MSAWLSTYAPLIVSILALGVSLFSLGWNIYRDVILKPRLKVAFGNKSMLREDEEHRLSEFGPPGLWLEVTNHGPGEVVCSHAVAKIESFAFLSRVLRKFPYRFLVPDHKHPYNFPPNHRMKVGDKIQLVFSYHQECFLAEKPKRVGIYDSFGRTHWAPRRDLKRALREYQKDFSTPRG
jgi:hypothetical protein